MRFWKSFPQNLLEEARTLRSPPLPAGIFLVATLSLIVCRDKRLSSLIQPELQSLSALLHVGPDCLHSFFALFLLPLSFLLLVRENPKRYGLCLGKWKLAIPIFFLLCAGLTLLGFLVGNMSSFQNYYGPSPKNLSDSLFLLLTYVVTMWSWEFFNRGFLLLGLKKYLGVYSVYVQLLPFVILHLGKPPFELYGSVLFGLFFGFYAYLVDSFIYGAIAHAYFAFVIRLCIGSG